MMNVVAVMVPMVTVPMVMVMAVVDMMSDRNVLDGRRGRDSRRDDGGVCRERSEREARNYQRDQGEN